MPHPRLRRYYRHGLIPQLLAFEACLRLGSVTRAAEELALAQPTVSGLLRKLSETVGEPVLRARYGRMEATEAGQRVALMCEEILDSLSRFDEQRLRYGAGRSSQRATPSAASAPATWASANATAFDG